MPNGDPRDNFLNPTLTLTIDSYIKSDNEVIHKHSEQKQMVISATCPHYNLNLTLFHDHLCKQFGPISGPTYLIHTKNVVIILDQPGNSGG